MLHIIRIPATCLDLPPLAAVAAAMARSTATAGGTPFHKPTFDGKLAAFERRLVSDARAGRLAVRDQDGGVGTVDEIVARAKADGTYSEVFPPPKDGAVIDRTVDIDRTLSLVLHVSIPQLNEWGAASGDTFMVDSSDVEWIDERGVVTPAAMESSTGTVEILLERVLTWVINGIRYSKAPWASGAREELRKLEASFSGPAERASGLATWLGNRADHYDKTDPASADQIREARGNLLRYLPRQSAPFSFKQLSECEPPSEAERKSVHRIERRKKDTLHAVIEKAKGLAVDPTDYQSVWAALVKLAEGEDQPAPLVGFCQEGIQYTGNEHRHSGTYDIFTRDALRKRMNPSAR